MKLSNYWYKLQNETPSITSKTTYSVVLDHETEVTYSDQVKGYIGGLFLTQSDYPNLEVIRCEFFRKNNGIIKHVKFFVGGYKK